MFAHTFLAALVLLAHLCLVASSPVAPPTLVKRTGPSFPSDIPSCGICATNYGEISTCAQAAPVLQNFTMILFNPGAFLDVIKCACTDTFKSAYPQCVDCFERTGQTGLLNDDNLDGTLQGLRTVCGATSVQLSNTTGADNETVPTTTPTPAPAAAGSGALPGLGAGYPAALMLAGFTFGVALLL